MEEENTHAQLPEDRRPNQIQTKADVLQKQGRFTQNALLRLKTETRVNETKKKKTFFNLSSALLERRVMRETLQMTLAQPLNVPVQCVYTYNNNEKATLCNLKQRCMYIFLHRCSRKVIHHRCSESRRLHCRCLAHVMPPATANRSADSS